MGNTPTFGWLIPERTDLPKITAYLKSALDAIDASLKAVRDTANTAAAAAADAAAKSMPKTGGTFTGKIAGVPGTVAADYVTKGQLDAVSVLHPAAGQFVGMSTGLGAVIITLPANKFSAPPRVVLFSMMSSPVRQSTTDNPYISDGSNSFFPAPTKDQFIVMGFPPSTMVRFAWAAWP